MKLLPMRRYRCVTPNCEFNGVDLTVEARYVLCLGPDGDSHIGSLYEWPVARCLGCDSEPLLIHAEDVPQEPCGHKWDAQPGTCCEGGQHECDHVGEHTGHRCKNRRQRPHLAERYAARGLTG